MFRRSRTALGWFGQVVAWLVILGVVAVLAVAVVLPRLAGATPYTVLTGSMRPDYPPGTLIVAKPVPFSQIGTGDVITYQRSSGSPTVVTHRVVAVSTRTDGETVLTTQGDANNTADAAPVRKVQVRGRLWYSVPYLGYVNNALNGRQRQIGVMGASALLVGYAAFMFVGAIRERRRRRSETTEPEPVPPVSVMPISTDTDAGRTHRRRRYATTAAWVAAGAVAGVGATLLVQRHGPSAATIRSTIRTAVRHTPIHKKAGGPT